MTVYNVIPAQAGIQDELTKTFDLSLDSRLRGNDVLYAVVTNVIIKVNRT